MSGEPESQVSVWTIDSLKEHLEMLMDERDRRNEQRFKAQEEAVAKAEAATAHRFEGVNEFRHTLSDQTHTFLPRTEYNAQHEALEARVEKNTTQLDKLEGRSTGINAGWIVLGQAISIIAAVIAIALVIAK